MIDNELVCGTEDYESVQEYYEKRKCVYCSDAMTNSERLSLELIPENIKMEEDDDKETKEVSNKQRALGRIFSILQKIPQGS